MKSYKYIILVGIVLFTGCIEVLDKDREVCYVNHCDDFGHVVSSLVVDYNINNWQIEEWIVQDSGQSENCWMAYGPEAHIAIQVQIPGDSAELSYYVRSDLTGGASEFEFPAIYINDSLIAMQGFAGAGTNYGTWRRVEHSYAIPSENHLIKFEYPYIGWYRTYILDEIQIICYK